MDFYGWLLEQQERKDHVGEFARIAIADKTWPKKSWRLYILLRRYSYDVNDLSSKLNHERCLLKIAHREWRKKEVTP